ncbi:MAG: D-glycerate dehydrogenase [Dethiosulfovibrio peptidovorans]|nr:MAG: D-glycerate dehydrogenase [Dethiosulfovibrio peptidovorans]
MNKVYVSHQIPEVGLSLLRDRVELRVWQGPGPVPREVFLNVVSDADGVIATLTERIDGEFFDHAPRVKVVSNYAVGYNNVDVAEAIARGVRITNTPGVLTEATADVAFGLLMAAARRFSEAERFLRSGQWLCWHSTMLLGREIFGATLGLVGYGRIARAVARRARGFGMTVLYHTPSGPKPDVQDASWVPLEELLRKSDFVSLHCPLTEATHHLIGAAELAAMKPDGVLINTARGDVVDQESLVRALKDGNIMAAGLDVYSDEPLAVDDPLLSLDNVVLLPHIGSATREAREAMAVMAASNVLAVLDGDSPKNPVN